MLNADGVDYRIRTQWRTRTILTASVAVEDEALGGARKAIAILSARIARSRFIRLLTAQPITRRECRSKITARFAMVPPLV